MKKFEKNLSEGNVFKQLLTFALPFILSNLIQSLYSVADMIIVGRVCGTASMSGVNIGGQMTFIITNLIIGLGTGATVLIGQYLGAGDAKSMKETISTLFTALIVLAVAVSVVMLVFREPVLRVINTPEESFEEASSYLFVTMLGTIFIFAYNALSAVMRGMGDSKHPMVFVAVACVINIGMDLLFVAVFDMKAFGAGLATVISQAVSVVLCVLYLRKSNFAFDFKLSSFRIYKERLRKLLQVGIPMSIQGFATSISFLFITAIVNTFGVTASAAVGAVGKFNGFAILPAIALGNSVSAVSSHNFGAGKIKRAVQTMLIGMGIAFVMSGCVFILVKIFPEEILGVFCDDAAMAAAGIDYFASFSFDYLIVPFVFTLTGLFIGSGHTMISLAASLISSLLVRIPAGYIFGISLDMGLRGVGLGAPFATAASLIVCIVFFIIGRWRKSAVLQ